MYSDLESDYVNPVEMCSKLNPVSLARRPLLNGKSLNQLLAFCIVRHTRGDPSWVLDRPIPLVRTMVVIPLECPPTLFECQEVRVS